MSEGSNQETNRMDGQAILEDKKRKHKIFLLSIIGEIEGHEAVASGSKATKYEHILPTLAEIEENGEVDGVLILLNTCGGDVESGLAIAEMIAGLSKPTVSLVLGGSHSIGVPLAVAADYSMIVSTGTMVIHPVRMSGTVINAKQTYDYFRRMQDRVVQFVVDHCEITSERFEQLLMNTGMMTRDLGSILIGQQAVDEKLICKVGTIEEAFIKLHDMIEQQH